MRTLLASLALLAVGCTDSAFDGDTAYRRLIEGYDSETACANGGFDACYQIMTFCANGKAGLVLDDTDPQYGNYEVIDSVARATLLDMWFDFDLETQTSAQLPGRRWALVEPLQYDCAP
jgi:hypothetical protein